MYRRMKGMAIAAALCVALLQAAPVSAAAGAAPSAIAEHKLEAIDHYVKEQFRLAGFPGGSYAVVERDKTVSAGGIGYADREKRIEATADTVYATASITKTMTAAVALRLVEDGLLRLDAPVTEQLPWFRFREEERSAGVTLRHLLTHSAGVSRFAADGAIYEDIRSNRNSLENAVRSLHTVRMNSNPGERGQYCNTCYNTAGLMIETAAALPYEKAMEERLFRPLGMTNTTFDPKQLPDRQVAKEYGYLFGFSAEVSPYWKAFGSSQAPEGGAYSSAADLAKLASALLGYGPDPFFSSGVMTKYAGAGVAASDLSDTVYTEAGLEEHTQSGMRILSKSGNGMGSTSELVLIPGQGVGIVVLVGEANEKASVIAGGIADIILAGHTTASVTDLPNVMKWMGIISLALSICSIAAVIGLIFRVMRFRKKAAAIRFRWAACMRLCLFAMLSAPFWYLLLFVRPTEAGFYGYPYDMAAAMILIAGSLTLWAVHNAVSLLRDRNR